MKTKHAGISIYNGSTIFKLLALIEGFADNIEAIWKHQTTLHEIQLKIQERFAQEVVFGPKGN
jgi:hypothetical protein